MKQKIPVILLITSALIGCRNYKTVPYNNIVIDASTGNDSLTTALIQPYKLHVDSVMHQVVGMLKTDLEKKKGLPETELGNFVADLTFDYASALSVHSGQPLPDFCILNFGGLRTSLSRGEVTLRDVYELMPFENKVVVVRLDYEHTKLLFDYLARVGGQPISNAQLVIRDTLADEIRIGDKRLDERHYYVVTSDYLANGGDNMTFFKDAPLYAGDKLRDVIIEHFRKYDGPVGSRLDNRIRYAE